MEKNTKKSYVIPNANITEEMRAKARQLTTKVKEKGLIKPHTVAFDKFSVTNEIHRGNENYFRK